MRFIYAYRISNHQPHCRSNPVHINVEHIALYEERNSSEVQVQLTNGTWVIVPMTKYEFEEHIIL